MGAGGAEASGQQGGEQGGAAEQQVERGKGVDRLDAGQEERQGGDEVARQQGGGAEQRQQGPDGDGDAVAR